MKFRLKKKSAIKMEKDKDFILKFNKLIKQIFNLCQKITLTSLQEYDGHKVNEIITSSEFNKILINEHLNILIAEIVLYKKFYNESMKLVRNKNYTDDMENNHIALFKNIYFKYLDNILTEEGNDDWIHENNLLIWYGETKGKKISKNGRGCVIRLSEIYQYAHQLEDTFQDDEEAEERNYADLFLLNLYKIFYLFASKKEREILNKHIQEIEADLGMDTQPNNLIQNFLGRLGTNSMEDMKDLVVNVFKKLSADSTIPNNLTEEQLREMVNGFSTEKLSETFSNINNIIKPDEDGKLTMDTNDLPSTITELFKNMMPMASSTMPNTTSPSTSNSSFDDEQPTNNATVTPIDDNISHHHVEYYEDEYEDD